MKAHEIIKSVLALSLAVIAVTSCQEKLRFGFTKGEVVKFSVGTEGSSLDTKAAYSSDGTSTIERIDWKENDLIRIYCAKVSEPENKYADYVVTSVDPPTSGATVSKAHIEGTGGVGLRWGSTEDAHVFYGMFPSPAVAGNSTSLGEGTMTGNIPTTQVPLELKKNKEEIDVNPNFSADDYVPNFTAVADLTSEYMVAGTSVAAGTQTVDGGVFLNFKPIVTAIEFTIANGFTTEGKLNIKSINLESASNDIAGVFTADLTGLVADDSKYPVCKSTAEGKIITMDFTGIPGYDYSGNEEISGSKNYITLTKGQSLRFTVFLKPNCIGETPAKPVDIDDITFRINKADGTWMSTRLGYTDGSGVVFPCHKKSFVTGLIVPEGAQWTVNYGSAGAEDPNAVTVVTKWNTGVNKSLNFGDDSVKWIDLGLPSGNRWADRNVGACRETDHGYYIAWGETSTYYNGSPKATTINWKSGKENGYAWQSYTKTGKSDFEEWPIKPYDETFLLLLPEFDAATVNISSDCRTPSVADWHELRENTTMTYINKDGVYGFKFEGKNGNSIFLPVNGLMKGNGFYDSFNDRLAYWTSSLSTTTLGNTHGYMFCTTSEHELGLETEGANRFSGLSIRAVRSPKPEEREYVEIGGKYWATKNVGATTVAGSPSTCYGDYFAWGETEPYYSSMTINDASSITFNSWKSDKSAGYDWASYRHCTGAVKTLTKYNDDSTFGTVDGKTILESVDDAATSNWGGTWRTPTMADFIALCEDCGCSFVDYASTLKTGGTSSTTEKGVYWCDNYDGVPGVLFSNGTNKVFFPATGRCSGTTNDKAGQVIRYWSSKVYEKGEAPSHGDGGCAWGIFSDSGKLKYDGYGPRQQGRAVRPVHD